MPRTPPSHSRRVIRFQQRALAGAAPRGRYIAGERRAVRSRWMGLASMPSLPVAFVRSVAGRSGHVARIPAILATCSD